ncbi:restriction endonuclease subunit S [Vibrio vulnificus]|uniref:restriction endonuclease subunit S n=1 Tax=Vibrio vulnificus TaxID=672 RepID=UPI0019D43F6A|nr:restriction endonuclease subunit S [Vibrio vulnificus]MBN8087677.1 restriction endonuclease subunit S [Vibrio vulnificus]MBN8116491.1 restriction endonuclease subunit S [Vibrio vulnificus]
MKQGITTWKISPLSELATVQSGVGFPKKYQGNESGEYPVYKVGDISKAYLGANGELDKAANYVSKETASLLKGKVFEENTVLFAKIGEALNLNRRVIVKKKGLADNNVMGVIPSNEVEPQYLYRFLQFFDIASLSRSTTVPSIRKSDVEMISVPHPSKQEQKKIADRLDSIFAKLEVAQSRLEKIPLLLKRFRMSVLSAAVTGELTEEWRDANPSLEAVLSNSFIQSYNGMSLDDLPQGWGWVSFKNAAKIESNLVDPKLTPSDIHLAPNHIEPNTGRILELVTVEQDKVKSNKHRFYPGQIIYSKIRPYLNKVCAVDFEGVCSADMYPVKANINREYLLYVMLSDMFVYWTSQQQGRVVLPKINQKALNEIPVPVPPNEEQNEIARIVGELWAKADAVEKQYNLAKLRVDKLTQSILARTFRGQLFEPFTDKADRVAQTQSSEEIDEQSKEQEEIALEQLDKSPTQPQPTPNAVDDKSELLSRLKSAKKAMTAQQLFDSASVETFKAIDELFVELKRLLELELIEKVGEGEGCQFKAAKK